MAPLAPPAPACTRTFCLRLDLGASRPGFCQAANATSRDGGRLCAACAKAGLNARRRPDRSRCIRRTCRSADRGARIHLVADLEVTDWSHRSGPPTRDIVTNHEWRLVLQQLLELTVADHLVQRVDLAALTRTRTSLAADLRFGNLGGTRCCPCRTARRRMPSYPFTFI